MLPQYLNYSGTVRNKNIHRDCKTVTTMETPGFILYALSALKTYCFTRQRIPNEHNLCM
jgi:hypothetical protein